MRTTALSVIALLAFGAACPARDVTVDNPTDIRAALKQAGPGDTINIKPGEYDMVATIVTGQAGTKDQPITLQCAGKTGYAKLKISAGDDIGFRLTQKFWVIRGLHIEGNTNKTKDLIQVSPTGGDVTLVDCKISVCREFLIKSSGGRETRPNNVVLDHCEWFDCPETAIDLVCGDNWVIRHNYVHDWGRSGSTHYGIFCKGGGRFAVVEGNIVDGKAGKGSIGISFGGGLTGEQWLPLTPDGKLGPEAFQGIARNNIVVNSGDCAFHSNNGQDCKFYNNLAYNCGAGFQMQASYPPDSTLINNVFSGAIKKPGKAENNLTKVDKAWFVAPDQQDFRLTDAGKSALAGKATPLPDNPTDFFGNPRKAGGPTDLGPVNADAKVPTKWVDARVTGGPTVPSAVAGSPVNRQEAPIGPMPSPQELRLVFNASTGYTGTGPETQANPIGRARDVYQSELDGTAWPALESAVSRLAGQSEIHLNNSAFTIKYVSVKIYTDPKTGKQYKTGPAWQAAFGCPKDQLDSSGKPIPIAQRNPAGWNTVNIWARATAKPDQSAATPPKSASQPESGSTPAL